MNDSEAIDRAALSRLLDWGGEKLRDQMIQLFLDNSGERMRQIESAFQSGSHQEVERGAHSLKSSAANVGAMELSRMAQKMEDAGSRAAMDEARELHEPLVEAHRRATTRLEELAEEFQT